MTANECPNCGSMELVPAAPGERRCEYCGSVFSMTKMASPVVACPRCGVHNKPGVRYCSQCALAIAKWTSGEKPKVDSAIISIVATVVGSLFVPIGGAVLGIILAYRARQRARATQGWSGSEQLARVALIVGWLGLAVSVFPLCLIPLLWGRAGVTLCSGLPQIQAVLING